MRNRLLAVCALFPLASGVLRAQDLAAAWQGTIPGPEGSHRVVVQIAKADSGGWGAKCFVELVHDNPQVDSMVVNGSNLKLNMDGGAILYDATFSADGNSLAGAWTSNHLPVPLELRRATQQAV